MAKITDIQELLTRQNDEDAESDALLEEVKLKHPGKPIEELLWSPTGRPPGKNMKIVEDRIVGICETCAGPEFAVQDKTVGDPQTICRDCINTIRRQSLVHNRSDGVSICLNCKTDVDRFGLIIAETHQTEYIDDQDFLSEGRPELNAFRDAFSDRFESITNLTGATITSWQEFETYMAGVINRSVAPANPVLKAMQRYLSPTLDLHDWVEAAGRLGDRIQVPMKRAGLTTLIEKELVDLTDGVVTWSSIETFA